jgi:hypothetical protein
MQLLRQLTNLSPRVARVLIATPEPISKRKPSAEVVGPTHRRRANGEVTRSVQKVLADGKPQKLAAIRVAAEKLLGEPVSVESVSWCLRMGCRKDRPSFVRIATGYYQLASRAEMG